MTMFDRKCAALWVLLGLALSGCDWGGGSSGGSSSSSSSTVSTYTVGGTVSGLTGSLTLTNNGSDARTVTANGSFTFATALASGAAYSVAGSQPTGQTCTVTNGSGAIASGNVTNVAVNCVTNTYTVAGTVSGLTGSGLVLQNNGADDLPRSADGAFTFATAIVHDSAYNVTVLTQPTNPAQTCTPSNNTGTATANVTTVTIACVTATTTGSAVIGPAGGTVNGAYGAQLVIPAGALSSTVTLGLVRDSSNSPAFAVTNVDAIGATYELMPHGTAFAVPVTLRIPFDATQLPNDEAPVLYKAEVGGAFAALPTTVNGNLLETTITNFSWVISGAQASKPRMVYAIQAAGASTPSELGSFKINKTSGALSAVTSSAAIGETPTFIVAHPSRRFVYVGHGGSSTTNTVNNIAPNSIAVYGLSTVNGNILGSALSNAITSAALGYAPTSAMVHPSGKFLYVLNGGALLGGNGSPGSGVDVFTINSATGALTLTNNSITGGMPPMGIAFNRLGTIAYVLFAGNLSSNTFSSQVKMYTVNPATGAMTGPTSGVAAGVLGSNPISMAIDPNGKFLYVATYSTDEVIAYSINASTGALSNIGSTTVTAASKLTSLAIDSFARFLYAGRAQAWLSKDVLAYQYNATSGALTSTGSALGGAAFVAVDPQGQFVYGMGSTQATNSFGINGFAVNQTTGALTAINSQTGMLSVPFAVTGASPVWQNNCTQSCALSGTVSSSGGGSPLTNPSPPTTHNLSVSVGAFFGYVTSSPGGINYGPPTNANPTGLNDFSADFPANSNVQLCSSPPPQPSGPYDVTWSGSCSGTGSCTGVMMDSDKSCHADFSLHTP